MHAVLSRRVEKPTYGSILTPLLPVFAEKLLFGGGVILDRLSNPRVVQEMGPVDVFARHVAGPRPAAQRIRVRQATRPAAAVRMGVRHVADHSSDVCVDGELFDAILVLGVDGDGVALAGELEDLAGALHHFVEVAPLPHAEYRGELLAGEPVFRSDFFRDGHEELGRRRHVDFSHFRDIDC